MDELKVGDVVQLKSGGPKMTVSDHEADGYVRCDWFEGSTRKQGAFLEGALQKVPDGGNYSSGGRIVRS